MGNISSQKIIQTVTVWDREYDIEQIAWTNTDGLSFDVYDRATGQLLTEESFDTWPGTRQIMELLNDLIDKFADGTIDEDLFFGQDPEALGNLRVILAQPFKVTYEIRSGIDGAHALISEGDVVVRALDEEEAGAKAQEWVWANDPHADERIDPSLEITDVEPSDEVPVI